MLTKRAASAIFIASDVMLGHGRAQRLGHHHRERCDRRRHRATQRLGRLHRDRCDRRRHRLRSVSAAFIAIDVIVGGNGLRSVSTAFIVVALIDGCSRRVSAAFAIKPTIAGEWAGLERLDRL